MGIVPTPLVSASASPVIPRQCLIHRAVVAVNESVDARTVMRWAVPRIDEHGCLRLQAANGMEHQPLHRDLPPRRVARISCFIGNSEF